MKVKIFLKTGFILTLSDVKQTDTHVSGTDKFGAPAKVRLDDVDEMLPIKQEEVKENGNRNEKESSDILD